MAAQELTQLRTIVHFVRVVSNLRDEGVLEFRRGRGARVAVGILGELATASVRTAAGPNGVAIRFGWFGWPRFTCSTTDTVTAEVIDLPFWAVTFGFWWTPGRTCCTVRSGPTLRLTLLSGRTVTVTVPDPHAAVAVLTKAEQA